jgi:hypothetical protein
MGRWRQELYQLSPGSLSVNWISYKIHRGVLEATNLLQFGLQSAHRDEMMRLNAGCLTRSSLFVTCPKLTNSRTLLCSHARHHIKPTTRIYRIRLLQLHGNNPRRLSHKESADHSHLSQPTNMRFFSRVFLLVSF